MNTIFEEIISTLKTENNLLSETRIELCGTENKITVLSSTNYKPNRKSRNYFLKLKRKLKRGGRRHR